MRLRDAERERYAEEGFLLRPAAFARFELGAPRAPALPLLPHLVHELP